MSYNSTNMTCRVCKKKMGLNKFETCKDCRRRDCKKCKTPIYHFNPDGQCSNCRAREQVRLKPLLSPSLAE